TEDLTGHALDDVYKQKEETAKSKINWYVEGPMIAGSVGLAGVAGAVYKILQNNKSYTKAFSTAFKEELDVEMNSLIKILENRASVYLTSQSEKFLTNDVIINKYMDISKIKNFLDDVIMKTAGSSIQDAQLIYDKGLSKYTLQVMYLDKEGGALKFLSTSNGLDKFNKFFENTLALEKQINNLPKSLVTTRAKYLNEVRNVAKSSGFEGESLKELMGNARKATGGVKMSFSAGEI
ncbi:hypothetical protein, partial [Francisella philomiragia]